MVNIIGSALCLFMSVSCGPPPVDLQYHRVKFHQEYSHYDKKDVVVQMAKGDYALFGTNHIGECLWFADPNHILIAQDYWNSASPGERWALTWHELGHCVYELHHPDDPGWVMSYRLTEHFRCPTSLMNPSIGRAECFDEASEQRYYIEELRNRIEREHTSVMIFKRSNPPDGD